jgi:hypothetical protein
MLSLLFLVLEQLIDALAGHGKHFRQAENFNDHEPKKNKTIHGNRGYARDTWEVRTLRRTECHLKSSKQLNFPNDVLTTYPPIVKL